MLITFIVGLSLRSQYSRPGSTSQKPAKFLAGSPRGADGTASRAIIPADQCRSAALDWSEEEHLESLALARQITDWAAEARAEDIVLLDVRKATYLADYFVICSATSERQMSALSTRIRERTDEAGVQLFHQEGTADSGWVLLDYGDVIVHIFSAALRSFYHLERVWSEATTVVRVL